MNIEDFYRFVLPELPDCSDQQVGAKLVSKALDFCRETKLWNEIADAVRLVDGVSTYDIDYPSGARALTVTEVWCGNRRLTALPVSQLDVMLPDWQTVTSSEPTYYNAPADWGSITVYPTPMGATASIRLRGVFIPKLNATVLPNFLFDYYQDALEAGVKGDLMLMPNQRWSNPELGQFYKAEYEKARTNARIDGMADRVPGITRVRPARFGG